MEVYTQFQQDVDEFIREYALGDDYPNTINDWADKMNFWGNTKKKENKEAVLSIIRSHFKVEKNDKIDKEIKEVLDGIFNELIEE